MKRGKLSAADRAGSRLLDYWQHRPEYGDPIGCVTTTFTFQESFFEDHCLSRFVDMDTDPDEDERSYLIEREEKLSQVFAAVLVDQLHVPLARSLRWHVLPMRVPDGGIFHAKLSLLAWERRVRVLVGSANMTAAGYRLNFENLAALDFGPEGGIPLALLREALALLEDYRQLAPAAGATAGPQPLLRSFLRAVESQVRSWTDATWPRGAPTAAHLPTGPTSSGARRPGHIPPQAEARPHAPAAEAWVMSPFFDDGDGAADTARQFEDALLLQRGDRSLSFVVSGRRHPDGIVEVDLPACLESSGRARVARHVELVTPEPDDSHRPLHAKSIWLRREKRGVHCIGSSNFTAAGTGIRPTGRANVEVNLAYLLPDLDDDFARVCERAYPPTESIDLGPHVRFLHPGDRTPEAEGHALLPAGFGGALVVLGTADPHLELEISAPPSGFIVSTEDQAALLDDAGWRGQGAPATASVPWRAPRPPSYLLVTWPAPDGARTAIWPVNVSDPRGLPAPEELRLLTLEDLVEVLSSARPAHEVLGRILRRKAERAGAGGEHETDPHRKVAELSKTFLLKRMRRIAGALEELRVRLEKPVFSREALAWRIHGPFGPLALADRLVVEEPDAASFLLAEVALTLRSVTPHVQGDLTLEDATAALAEAEARLAALARTRPAPPNLAAYVETIFAERQP